MISLGMRRSIVAVAVGTLVGGCGGGDGTGTTPGRHPAPLDGMSVIELPEPARTGPVSLEEAVAARRSVRSFSARPLGLDDLSQLLWAAQGTTEDNGRGRAAPSAGGTYPLEIYAVTPDGHHHYLPDRHALEPLGTEDLREELAGAAVGQQHVADAPLVVVVTAVFSRTEDRYGERAERYVILEAGHAAQNVLLQAVALGLGAVPVGAFSDGAVGGLLGLPADHAPLYLISVGHPDGD